MGINMNFLLTAVNAKYIHSNPAVYSLKKYAGAMWESHIGIAEYTINNRPEEILADLFRRKPDILAFSCYIWNWALIKQLLPELSKVLPGVPVWLGGPEVSYGAEVILKQFPMLSGIMSGEGEETFLELLALYGDRMESGGPTEEELEQIAGLILPTGSTLPRQLTDLNKIPFLYDDPKEFENRILYYESSRGCPFRCSYCLSSIDREVRLRDISVVKEELLFFLRNHVKQVKFIDRTFNCNRKHALEIWNHIMSNDNNVTNFHFEISADLLDEECINLLNKMRPGLVQLEIGVQSANPLTLREIRRSMDLEKLKENVEAVKKTRNIHQHLDLIAGLPYEDYESFKRSFNIVYAMKPEQLQLGFLKVLKGSHMHEKSDEYGMSYTSAPPYEVLYTKWISYEEILKLKEIEEMVETYYNSSQFTHMLPYLEQKFDSPFVMYEKLAEFYKEEGYFTTSPARIYRYRILLAFALLYDREREALYRELLTYDLYLRENAKSRPEYALELEPHKKSIREFYASEEKERSILPSYGEYDARQLSRVTHMEPFTYEVWDMEAMGGRRLETTAYVIFDYLERNPLTQEARTVILCDKGKQE